MPAAADIIGMDRSLCPNCSKLKREVSRLKDEIEELEREKAESGSSSWCLQCSSDAKVIQTLEQTAKN